METETEPPPVQRLTTQTESDWRLRDLSERVACALKPLRLLEAIRWDPTIEAAFLARGGRELPAVSQDTYQRNPPIVNLSHQQRIFDHLEQIIHREYDANAGVGALLLERCRQGQGLIQMLRARGTEAFARLSREFYGTTLTDHVGDARLQSVLGIFDRYAMIRPTLDEAPRLSAEQTLECLSRRLGRYFEHAGGIRIEITAALAADAAARGEGLRLRQGARFSLADLRMLEVHEGWVHLGTTLNSRVEPRLACLGRCTPAATRTQEGLAVLTELLTGAAGHKRLRRLRLRLHALAIAERGTDFRGVYRFLLDHDLDPREAYQQTMRLFRGSLPDGGPFTKDLCYGEGLLRLIEWLDEADRTGQLALTPLLFVGKVALEEVPMLAAWSEAGLIAPPRFVPAVYRDPNLLAQALTWLRPTVG